MGIVYTLLNRTTLKVYVGQTWEPLSTRWERHKSKARCGDTSCRHLYAAIRKYGVDDFAVRVQAFGQTQDELDELERYWITELRTQHRDFGYNLKSGGSAGRHSVETRERMSATRKGKANAGSFPKGVLSSPSPFPKGHRPWNRQFDPPLTGAQRQARYRASHPVRLS